MSRFHRYSVNNTMLIYMQKPEATLVAGYNKWKNQFERHVKKGERGITIIAPTPYKKKIEEQKLASALSGNVQNYEIFMEALRRAAPVPIDFEAMDAETAIFLPPNSVLQFGKV